MEDARIYLVGCVLNGLASKDGPYFGIAEDAIGIADATLNLCKKEVIFEHGKTTMTCQEQFDYEVTRELWEKK